MWNHYVARTSHPYEPFKDFATAQWTWEQIHHIFPDAVAGVLMPNHIHLILPKGKLREGATVTQATRKLSGLLGCISKRLQVKKLWQPIPPPAEIPDSQHLRRQIRYVALNPCRKKLCRDPLEWYWSTYREWMGATVVGRDSLGRLASSLQESPSNFRVRLHAYVSGDPTVSISGTPPPQGAPQPKKWPTYTVDAIWRASAAALRVPLDDIKKPKPLRNLFIQMASRHRWHQSGLLAEMCEISLTSVQNHFLKSASPECLAAADLCLGDPRLRSCPHLAKLE